MHVSQQEEDTVVWNWTITCVCVCHSRKKTIDVSLEIDHRPAHDSLLHPFFLNLDAKPVEKQKLASFGNDKYLERQSSQER